MEMYTIKCYFFLGCFKSTVKKIIAKLSMSDTVENEG